MANKLKRSLEDGKRERAAAAKAANARERNIAQQYLNAGPSIGNLARAAYHWYNSVPMLGGQNENGLIIIKGDVPTPGMRSSKAIAQSIKTITKANAAKITPAQWTAAQDAAIARGDIAEAQRLRDLHFKTKASKNKLIDGNGNPVAVKHHGNVWNVFDPDKTMSGTLWTANEDAFKLNDIKTFPASDLPTEWKNLYINMKNPIQDEVGIGNTRMLSEIRKGSKDAIKESIRDYGVSNPDGVFKRIKITEDFLKKNGYDLNDPEIRKILNNPEFYGKEPTMAATAYPNNIKSADAVTYDNKGVRIPLGERDNFNINDIRYGLIPLGVIGTGYGAYNSTTRPKHKEGGIYIKPSKRGTFTAAATKHGMGVQEFVSRVLRNKDSYSPAMVKKANFARNASKWN